MHALLLLAALAVPSAEVDPVEACEAAATVLRDLRYEERGRWADRRDLGHPAVQARLARCVQVARLAAPHGPDLTFASIAVAYAESNFRLEVEGSAGELGMLQVIPRYHCRPYPDLDDGQGGCTDPVRAGVRALRIFVGRHGVREGLALYNGSLAYARRVAGYAEAARWAWRRAVARGEG